jgi:predicted nuclease of restriction endonuclease-like (RecB) superfamily
MPNNFMQTIPERQQALKAIEMFKDEYLLDYINVEELGCREEDIDERVIENSIVHNIKNFIMTFGKSFSYLGHQVHYEKLGEDHWVDLLFFNRELRSLVVVELKRGAFKPSYLGQLQTYLRILDDDERLQGENPSVGIILCRDANRAYVEYVLQDYRKPMGVATYQVTVDKLKSLLPNEDEMRKLLTSNEEDGGSDNND